MICTHRILRMCHCGYSDISCLWRKTPLKRLPIRVRGSFGEIVLKESILWIRVRVIILNLQINVKFEVYLKHLDLRDEKFVMKRPSFSIRKYIKHRYGLQCFHWVLSSYKFPARSFESSNGHCGRTSQHRQKRQRTSWAVVTFVTCIWKLTQNKHRLRSSQG